MKQRSKQKTSQQNKNKVKSIVKLKSPKTVHHVLFSFLKLEFKRKMTFYKNYEVKIFTMITLS